MLQRHLMADHITPPGSFVSSILTPPPTGGKAISNVSLLIDTFQRHRKGYRPDPWIVYPLAPGAYTELLRRLRFDIDLEEYVRHRVRYDYDPRRSVLTIRMPTPLHEIFCAEVAGEGRASAG